MLEHCCFTCLLRKGWVSHAVFHCKSNSCMAESLVRRDSKCYAEDSLRKFDKQSSNIGYCMLIMCL